MRLQYLKRYLYGRWKWRNGTGAIILRWINIFNMEKSALPSSRPDRPSAINRRTVCRAKPSPFSLTHLAMARRRRSNYCHYNRGDRVRPPCTTSLATAVKIAGRHHFARVLSRRRQCIPSGKWAEKRREAARCLGAKLAELARFTRDINAARVS